MGRVIELIQLYAIVGIMMMILWATAKIDIGDDIMTFIQRII